MKLTLGQQLAQFNHLLQGDLFPVLEQSLGELGATAKRLVALLELISLGRFLPPSRGWVGRPAKDRQTMARAFVAKAVFGFSTTRQLLHALHQDAQLRKICGWQHSRQIPHESTFSRAFAEFAAMQLPQSVHHELILETQRPRLIGHITRDSTAIEARERFPKLPPPPAAVPKFKPWGRKRPKRGQRGLPKTRLEQQRTLSLEAMLADLPRHCSLGVKTSSDGNQKYWRGYKLHLDVADGQIPISAILTAACLHDSQVAIPLATMTSQRVTNLYDLMDTAYHAGEIFDHSRSLGHVPIIKPPKRQGKKIAFRDEREPAPTLTWAEEERFKERTTVERVYARLKDEFGGREIRVRGHGKIMAHLMFGVLALTADQILKLAP